MVQNQPHKQLERAMKEQQSSARGRQETSANRNRAEYKSNDRKVDEQPQPDSAILRKAHNSFSRDTSAGREKGPSKTEIFDGSFGRKKREDADYEKDRKFRYKIEAPTLLHDNYEQRRPGASQFSSEMFEGRFGSKGPSGRINKTTRLN